MYESLLFIHSWTRWVVFIGLIYFLIKATSGWLMKTPWKASDGHFIWAFDQVFGYQVLFGLTLWLGLSPYTKTVFKDFNLLWENPVLFFWTLRHGLTMILALGVFHMGKGKAKRASDNKKYKIFAFTFAGSLLLVISAIPWPWLSYGRALIRWFA